MMVVHGHVSQQGMLQIQSTSEAEALVEACLAHQKKDHVAAAYNHARLSGPRRVLMQIWADMLDSWMRGESAREVIALGKAKIDAAAHDAEGMNL